MLDLSANSLSEPLVTGANNILPKIPSAIVAFLAGVIIIKGISWIADLLLGLVRLPKGLRSILHSLIDGLLWIFLIITVLQSLGMGNLALVFSGALAAAGLALAGGGSSLASDVLSGIFLAKDKDFNIGDEVIAGEKPTQGVIQSMDMRRTRILGDDGKLHILPNSIIERKEWVVLAKKSDRT